jgi:Family of unknown function (DUF5681)
MTLVETGDNRPIQHRNLVAPWKPGQSGNPAGRPKGSRNKLAEQFFVDIYENWTKNGAATVEQVRVDDPSTYLRVVAQALPKEFVVK